jgi:hypothetical protein
MYETIQDERKLEKYDLILGEIVMTLDREHRGEVTVAFAEKKIMQPKKIFNPYPKVILGNLDTRKGFFWGFEDCGRDSLKLNPGAIHLQDWNIDSTDAVKIAEEFFSSTEGFRYDEVYLYTANTTGLEGNSNGEERWRVKLRDRKNEITYNLWIDVYTGEALSDNMQK